MSEYIIGDFLALAMAICFRHGVGNTDLIPMDIQKAYIQEYVFEIIEDGEYDVNPAFILAIIQMESRYDWKAQNGVHTGLMQINPQYQTARMEKLDVEDLAANPYDNIKVGVDYVDALFKMYPSKPYDVLNCYNSGHTDGYPTSYAITVMDYKYEIEHRLWDEMEGW